MKKITLLLVSLALMPNATSLAMEKRKYQDSQKVVAHKRKKVDTTSQKWLAVNLMEAVITHSNNAQIEKLIALGADPNSIDQTTGHTPLTFAAQLNNIDAIGALLNAGAKIDSQNKKTGDTAILIATKNNKLGLFLDLLRNGAKFTIANNDRQTVASLAQGNIRLFINTIDRIYTRSNVTSFAAFIDKLINNQINLSNEAEKSNLICFLKNIFKNNYSIQKNIVIKTCLEYTDTMQNRKKLSTFLDMIEKDKLKKYIQKLNGTQQLKRARTKTKFNDCCFEFLNNK